VVAAGTEVVRIASARPGVVVCWLPERFVTRIEPGRLAQVHALGLWQRGFEARVAEIAPGLEEVPPRARLSATIPVWGRRVVLEGKPDRSLIAGEAVNVRF
jgi:hypothetical protein